MLRYKIFLFLGVSVELSMMYACSKNQLVKFVPFIYLGHFNLIFSTGLMHSPYYYNE